MKNFWRIRWVRWWNIICNNLNLLLKRDPSQCGHSIYLTVASHQSEDMLWSMTSTRKSGKNIAKNIFITTPSYMKIFIITYQCLRDLRFLFKKIPASSFVKHIGGLIRKTLPCKPPLPIKTPRSVKKHKISMHITTFNTAGYLQNK